MSLGASPFSDYCAVFGVVAEHSDALVISQFATILPDVGLLHLCVCVLILLLLLLLRLLLLLLLLLASSLLATCFCTCF